MDDQEPTEENSRPRLADEWLATERFNYPYTSPMARRQDLEYLAATVVEWAREGAFELADDTIPTGGDDDSLR